MKRFALGPLSAALLAATLLSAPASLLAQTPTPGMGPVATQEKMIWDALKAGTTDSIVALMAPDFVYVGPEGISDRAAAAAGMKMCKLNSYSVSNPMTRSLGKDALLVTYSATVDTDCGPAPNSMHFSGNVNCSSLWVRRDGKWWALSHTETPAMKMPAPPPQ